MSDILLPTISSPAQGATRQRFVRVLLYLAALTLAEALASNLASANLGLLCHGVVLMTLLLHAAYTLDPPAKRLYLAVALAPLVRLVGLSLPLQNVPLVYGYPLVGAPVLLAVLLVMRYTGFTPRLVGLTINAWPLQLLLGASGLGLGYLEYLILRPAPWVSELSLAQLLLPALVLLVFTGFLEELIFRGVMQRAACDSLGWLAGLFYTSALFAVLHIGYKSAPNLLLVFGAALLFGVVTLLSGSILGTSLAHGLTNIALYLIFPALLAAPQPGLPGLPGNALPPAQVTQPGLAPAGETLQLLVDDGDAGFLQRGGESWQVPQGTGGDLLWAVATSEQASVLATWQADIAQCGRYRLEAFIPGDYATTRKLAYQVLHRDGVERVVVDQLANQGAWAVLGEFWFAAGQRARVSATNLTGEAGEGSLVAFDAMRWVLLRSCPP